jgi:hypothetical protein
MDLFLQATALLLLAQQLALNEQQIRERVGLFRHC